MKTKNSILILVSLMVIISCKKKEKCSDSIATNNNQESVCIYPSDKLVGEYYVTEYILPPSTRDTNYFTATVSKATNTKVAVKYTRNDNPTYDMPDTLEINWGNKNFENMQPGDANNIIDDNTFSIIFFEFTTPLKPIRHNFARK